MAQLAEHGGPATLDPEAAFDAPGSPPRLRDGDTAAGGIGSGGDRRRLLRWWALGAGVFALTYALMAGRIITAGDEAWFLWIAHRVAKGEILYRDVYSVTTPLPTWIAALAVEIFGTELLVVRALSTACFTAEAVLALVLATRAGLSRTGRALLLGAVFLFGSPAVQFTSIYSQLAIASGLVTMLLLARWLDDPARRYLVGTGLAVGVGIGSKPNIGMLVGAGALAVVLVRELPVGGWRAVGRSAAPVIGASAGIGAVMVSAVALRGGLDAFVGDIFTGKSDYLSLLGGSVPPGARQFLRIFDTDQGLRFVFLGTQCLAILACAGAIAATARRARRDAARLTLVVSGALAAIGSMYPGTGYQHVAEAMPLLLAAAAMALGWWLPRRAGAPRPVVVLGAVVVAAWLAFGAVAVGAHLVKRIPRAIDGDSAPHFTGAVILRWPGDRSDLERLRELTGGTVFILRADAPFYYLAGGLENPTRYDFPARSDLGADGEAGVIRELRRDRVEWVCLWDRPSERRTRDLYPRDLDRHVRAHGELVAALRPCDLYRLRPGAS